MWANEFTTGEEEKFAGRERAFFLTEFERLEKKGSRPGFLNKTLIIRCDRIAPDNTIRCD